MNKRNFQLKCSEEILGGGFGILLADAFDHPPFDDSPDLAPTCFGFSGARKTDGRDNTKCLVSLRHKNATPSLPCWGVNLEIFIKVWYGISMSHSLRPQRDSSIPTMESTSTRISNCKTIAQHGTEIFQLMTALCNRNLELVPTLLYSISMRW